MREHPDYLFGKINYAYEYYYKNEYDRIPEILGKSMELKDLYPERNCFHLVEVANFLRIAIRYFCAVGNLEAAETRFEILEELDPDHSDTDMVAALITKTRFEAIGNRFEEENKNKIRVRTGDYDKTIQTKTPPEFINPEINMLYEKGLEIERGKLEKILSLPRNELISDLTAVVQDSISRYEYFMRISQKKGWQEDNMNFSVHAIFLLGELRADQCLPVVLETFRQGEEFMDFWYGDLLTGELWVPLYYLGEDQLDVLKEFVLSPGIWKFARSLVCECVLQIAFHQPARKEEVTDWFRDLFRSLAGTPVKANIIDSDFIGLTIWIAMELGDAGLLSEIRVLFDLGYVSERICGTFEEIEGDITPLPDAQNKKSLFNIFDIYRNIVSTWAVYNKKENKSVPTAVKPGRNDPCPCGSGKKYKKCCLIKA